MRRRTTALPLWLWLAVALLAIVTVPMLATWALSTAVGMRQQQADQSRLNYVRRLVGTDVRQWKSAAWQRRIGATLADQRIELRLVDADGRQIYITSGARRILSSYTGWSPPRTSLDFEKMGITRIVPSQVPPTDPALGKRLPPTSMVIGTVSLWFARAAPGSPPSWAVPAGAVTSLMVTLAAVTWLLGWAIVRPLTAMSRAVEEIASGDLDTQLPSSRAREVARVGTALSGLSATLRETLQQQIALEDERRLFVGAIAHDLRTPLFMLRGYLQGLETGVAKTPDQAAQYVRACSTRADALEKLIADLFAYTRLEYLDESVRREPCALEALLGEVVEVTQSVASTKAVTLTLTGSPPHCVIDGDIVLLSRAFQNMLDNAVRYTPNGGAIAVLWRLEGSQARVHIEDTGPGIAPHALPHVFTPLYRAEESRNRQTGGAGLGLSIARRIFQAHGGDLTAANLPLKGAVFTATLPLSR